MGAALPIVDHHDALERRALARQEKNGHVSSRSAGRDRQTLHDWVVGYNADGIETLYDQPKGHNPEKPSESEQPVPLAKILKIQIPYLRLDAF